MQRFKGSRTVSRLGHGCLLGLLCGLLLLPLRALGRLDGFERATLDVLFQLRGSRYPARDIRIVVVDNETVTRFGGWPLPRRLYADVVRRLHRAGARTIVFVVLFPTAAPSPRDDQEFVRACREAGSVVHAAVLRAENAPTAAAPFREALGSLPPQFQVTDQGAPTRNAIAASRANDPLLATAVGLGNVGVFPELDGVLRRIPNVMRFRGDGIYPSLALAGAAHHMGLRQRDIIAVSKGAGGELRLAGRRIPLDENGETLVNWVGGFPTFNFNELFDGRVNPATFKDSLVIVGVTAAGAYERLSTPFSPNQAAVELQANAMDDILSNRPLREAATLLQLALLLGFPALVGALIADNGAKRSALRLAMLCLLLAISAGFLLSRANFYLPVAAPLIAAMLACATSIGERQVREARALRLAEERYALAVRGANDGVWDWNLKTDEIYFSPRWTEMLGFEEHEIGNRPAEWFDRIHPDDLPDVQHSLAQHRAGIEEHFYSEYRLRHKSGEDRWMLARGLQVRDEKGRPERMAGSQSDITARKKAEDDLRRNAFYDSLTGLPNRAFFLTRLEQALGHARRRPDYLFAVLFFDLDRFKNVNDSLGHAQGDELLKEVARRLTDCLRPGDTPARLGGDEFTLLLDDISDINDATRVADRFQQELARPYNLGGHELSSAVSIGIALSTTGYDQPEDILRDADTAMYRAKAIGTGRREIFDTAMHARAVSLLRLETDLRRALERENFRVHYQAIVSLGTGRITGFEALARWHHPTRGLISPAEFMPIAEDTGLIIPIDQWVLRESCRQTHAWHKKFKVQSSNSSSLQLETDLTISVNLSSKQFSQPNLVAQIERALHDMELQPANLKLEITEGAIMENPDVAAAMLQQLKTLGVQLSIDDFGTGYSSLSYLHRFPLDTLKIDRSFISRLGPQGENMEIVQTIITLSRNLGMKVIAEGVETPEQLAQLRALGCDYGQGYLFSKPLSDEDASALLLQQPQW